MSEIQQNYIDALGNHFVATFDTSRQASEYVPPIGAIAVSAPPSSGYSWVNGAWVQDPPPVPAPITSAQVDTERERRIALPLAVTVPSGSFTIDMDAEAQRNIAGLATAALQAKMLNVTLTEPFRAYDNVMHDLTADDLLAMGNAVMARISAMYAKSWALKAMTPIPQDYTADGYW